MNIYFCREYDTNCGLYVIAEKIGRAKLLYALECDCEYIDVRYTTHRKNVNEKEGIIDDINSPILKKYNLKYETEGYLEGGYY